MKKIVNILVLEDNQADLEYMLEAIQKEFGNSVHLYPDNMDDPGKTLKNFNFLIGTIQEGESAFKGIAEFYKEVDLFIIDASLTGDGADKTGIEFAKYLKTNKRRPFKTILVSNGVTTSMEKLSDCFIFKPDHGKNFPTFLSQKIGEIYPLVLENADSDDTVASTPDRETIEIGLIKYVLHEMWLDLIKNRKHGWTYAFHKVQFELAVSFERNVIDKCVSLLFYVLLLVTIFAGGYNIITDIIERYTERQGNGATHEPVNFLKTPESIFLNLLPIFIVFGFFNYYKSNTRITLLKGYESYVDHEASTKTMNLTKTLFVSSIVSYVIIKIIEVVFRDGPIDLTKLISFGLLLLILMGYFILLEKKGIYLGSKNREST